MSYIDTQEIYRQTNGGLDIIQHYFPDAKNCTETNKHFKLRSEKTASATLYNNSGIWAVHDFGDGEKPKNAIDIIMLEEGITDFHEALLFASGKYTNGNISSESKKLPQAKITRTEKSQPEVTIEYNDSFSKPELLIFGEKVTPELLEKYNVKSVKSFTNKNGLIIESTNDFPIFCYDYGTWQKIYQPFGGDYRFQYVGDKPKDYIFGLNQIKDELNPIFKTIEAKVLKAYEKTNLQEHEINKLIKNEIKSYLKTYFYNIIICSGERDALNVAAHGYKVIWFNSETATITANQYREISKLCHELYNLPDIDSTGIKQAIKLGLNFLDIRTIYLPEDLKQKRDSRGKTCKDATDFFKYYPKAESVFKKLVNVSVRYRFWDAKLNNKNEVTGYAVNNLSLIEFLKANGYYRYEDRNNKYGYIYVKVTDNIVERIEPDKIRSHVKDFTNKFLIVRRIDNDIKNVFLRTNQLNEESLSNIPIIDTLDFNSYSADYEHFFFKNVAWKISKDSISEVKIKDVNKSVWKHDIKDKVEAAKLINEPMFVITENENYESDIDRFNIKINEKQFIFFKFLMNTCKIYWKKEKQGEKLTENEKKEQRLHLINKIYSLGYLAHRFKNPSKAWATWSIDARESESNKSFGGSGKSIYNLSIEHINKSFYLGGRNPKLTDNPHIFHGIDKHIKNVLIDDADQYLNFGFFFPFITGKFNVNPKHGQPFALDYCDSPKMSISSNFPLRTIDPSTERRLLYSVFSDYYHKQDDRYSETISPQSEFGKNIFDDFTQNEWNQFYNFMALCIQTYLKFNDKIDPPMENVEKRNLRTQMNDNFLEWANNYFSDDDHINNYVNKLEAMENYKLNISVKDRASVTSRVFKDKLRYYCKYCGYIFNPADFMDKDKKKDSLDYKNIKIDGKTIEHFYIQTIDDIQINDLSIANVPLTEEQTRRLIEDAKTEPLPF